METITADRWIYSLLHNDATLAALVTGVYTWPAPETGVLPYVLFQEQAATDLRQIGPARVWVNGLWLVRVVAEARGWGGAIETAANRVDALLHGAAGSVAGSGTVWGCVREQPFRLVEPGQGGRIRHLGGIYRIFVK